MITKTSLSIILRHRQNILEPYYRRELNPHAPKLDDMLYGNGIIILRISNPSRR
jgi:hypothetical protein